MPENTIFFASAPAASARWSSPPETMSNPLPSLANVRSTASRTLLDLLGLLSGQPAEHQEAADVVHALAVDVRRRPLPREMHAVGGGLAGEAGDCLGTDLIRAARVGFEAARGDQRGARDD